MKITNNKNIVVALSIIILGALSRMLPHPPNVTPIAAIALLGGAYINKKYLAYMLPFIILFTSDFLLNNTLLRSFYPDVQGLVIWQDYMWFVYIGFGVMVGLGILLRKFTSLFSLVNITIVSTLAFFMISNFGTWFQGILYPKTMAGLILCYEAALPFLLNSLLGNMMFVALFFAIYQMANNSVSSKKIATT